MASEQPLEVVFYVHGVNPGVEGRLHTGDYTNLHQGIAEAGVDDQWPEEFGGAEWGWNFDDAQPRSHRALTTAQKVLGGQVFDDLKEQPDLTFNPARLLLNGLRKIIFYGFGDMFYYVSADGKWAVRAEVASQLLKHIEQRRGDSDEPISLTLLGHSAGSVIAFDFLYYLFSKRKRGFLRSDDDTAQGMATLKEHAGNGRLRLRRLVTFGSPISLLAFRSNALVEIFARDETLEPEDYGLVSKLPDQPDLDGPRWINIWDKDDPIAWPIAPIMDSPLAKDVYVDVSDKVSAAHDAYWESKKAHRAIASSW